MMGIAVPTIDYGVQAGLSPPLFTWTGCIRMATRSDAKRFATLLLPLAVLLWSCADAESDAPPAEPEGVFGQAPAAIRGIPSVITLEPLEPVEVRQTGEALMDQIGFNFSPQHLLVRVGEAVHFHNSEATPHNVRVLSLSGDSTVFNEDTLQGQIASFLVDEEGGYDVTCDVHPGMTAFIFATSAAYAVFADRNGAFHLPEVSAGEYALEVWSVDAAVRSARTIQVREAEGTEVMLTPLPGGAG